MRLSQADFLQRVVGLSVASGQFGKCQLQASHASTGIHVGLLEHASHTCYLVELDAVVGDGKRSLTLEHAGQFVERQFRVLDCSVEGIVHLNCVHALSDAELLDDDTGRDGLV